jgi:hypothetical protein
MTVREDALPCNNITRSWARSGGGNGVAIRKYAFSSDGSSRTWASGSNGIAVRENTLACDDRLVGYVCRACTSSTDGLTVREHTLSGDDGERDGAAFNCAAIR